MKKLILLLLSVNLFNIGIFAQCNIDSFIEANYELDAKLLALRDILADPSDPDFDNPFLPEERVIPYLERLSAIFENPHNVPEIDMLFNDFNIQVNQEYNYPIEFKTLAFRVDTALPWVEDFRTTSVSGIPELDNLMSTYQFSVDHFWDLNTCSCTVFFIETDYDFLNLNALIDDFELVDDIVYAEPYMGEFIEIRHNYTGIDYYIDDEVFGNSEIVMVCDIIITDDVFSFRLYAGDCPAGCTLVEEVYAVEVTDDCRLLSNAEVRQNVFSIYPNPAVSYINITSNIAEKITVSVFDIQGKQVINKDVLENTLDVSLLTSGVYILKISQNERIETKKLIIQ